MKRFAAKRPTLLPLLLIFSAGLSAETVVTGAPYSRLAVFPRISAAAIVVSPDEADLSARITARVEKVMADVGATVSTGDTLVTLECDDYQLALRMARARLEAARAELKLAQNRHRRATELLQQQLTSEESADATAASLAAARAEQDRTEAALGIAELDRSRCDVTAPFDGTVTARYVSRGQLASAGDPLLRLVNHRHLEVAAQISEKDLHTFNADTEFTFNGLDRYPLKLARTVQALDRQTRTQEIRLVFGDRAPLPGSAGKVTWHSSQPHIPAAYLTVRDGITGYFAVEAGIARFVPLGDFLPEKAQPAAIPADTTVITEGIGRLEDGAPVSVEMDAVES